MRARVRAEGEGEDEGGAWGCDYGHEGEGGRRRG